MVLYHFGSKDELVADGLRCSNERSVADVVALPASADLRAAVLDDVLDRVHAEPVDAHVGQPVLGNAADLLVDGGVLEVEVRHGVDEDAVVVVVPAGGFVPDLLAPWAGVAGILVFKDVPVAVGGRFIGDRLLEPRVFG